jgi:pilus assembly protein CpaB
MSRRRRGALLIGLALALGGLAASDVSRREAAVDAQLAPLVNVVVAHRDVGPGRQLRAGDLALRRIPARYAPVGAAAVPEEVIGRKLAAAVPRGGYLAAGQFESEAQPVVAPMRRGERAVEVVGTGSAELVVPGVRVDVVTAAERGAAQLALEGAEVLAVRAVPAPEDPQGPGAARVAATLRVTVRQALLLASLESRAREVRLLPRP